MSHNYFNAERANIADLEVLKTPFLSLAQMVHKHSKFLEGEMVVKKKGRRTLEHAETSAEHKEAKVLINKILTHNGIKLPVALKPTPSGLPFYMPGNDYLEIPCSLLV